MSDRLIIRTTGSTGPSGEAGTTALDDLTDVTITAAASGDILRHNGTAWVDTPGTTHFEVAGAVAAHESDTTSVHGIADTSALETTTGSALKVSTHAALTSSVHGISAFGATLVDDADASAARTTLGLVIGTNVQAFDSDLSTIAAANNGAVLAATTASFTTADETKLDGIASGATVYTDEMARDALGTALVAGSNITITPNDGADTITIAASGGDITTATAWAAKGDLIAATGNDAAAILTVGSDSLVPIANSNASTGIRYGSIIQGQYQAGTLLAPNLKGANSTSVAPPAAGRMGAVFVWIPKRLTIDRVEINCTTAQAGETLRIGIYDNVGGVPTNLIADWGTVDVSTTGGKSITGLTTVVDPGLYWIAYVPQGGTANARYWGSSNAAGVMFTTWSSATSDWTGGLQASAATTTGALPSTFGAVGSLNNFYLFVCPRMA